MRILLLTPLYEPHVGGLETLVRQLVSELRSRGHEAAIITSHGAESRAGLDHIDGVPVRRVDAHDVVASQNAAGILRVQREIHQFTRAFEPHLVHCHDAGPVLWMYHRVIRRTRYPLVVTLHNVMSRKFGSVLPILGKMLRDADWVTGVSQAVVDDVLGYEPSVESRMSVIINGIVPPLCDVSPIPRGSPRLVCIGRLDEQKGFDLAIAAFARLRECHPSARLAIAGDGPERDHLLGMAQALDVDDGVDFLGSVGRDHVARLLRECTLVVMPSRFEGLPLVALEAAFAGRPIVATDSPGLSEAIVPDETALVVPPEDVDALANAVAALLSDPRHASALGEKAHAFATERFALERCVDQYEALYERVLQTAVW